MKESDIGKAIRKVKRDVQEFNSRPRSDSVTFKLDYDLKLRMIII